MVPPDTSQLTPQLAASEVIRLFYSFMANKLYGTAFTADTGVIGPVEHPTLATQEPMPPSANDAPVEVEKASINVEAVGEDDTANKPEGSKNGGTTGAKPTKGGLWEPDDWDSKPFESINRTDHYCVHSIGVKWLEARLPEFDKIEGPQGVDMLTYDRRLAELRFQWKKGLAESYMSHWPNFNFMAVLPPNPSQEQELTAKTIMYYDQIDNMLTKKRPCDTGADIIDMLFKVIHRTTAKDVWAHNDPEYKDKETKEMEVQGWTTAMDPKKVRKELFAGLPDDEREKRKAEAKKAKAIRMSREEILSSLPRLFALIGDAVASRTGWYVEVRSAGLGDDNQPNYFIELEVSKVQDQVFIAKVAKANKVEIKNLIRVPPWKPNNLPVNTNYRLKVKLRNMVAHNEEGNITIEVAELRQLLLQYMEYTYALVPAAQTGRRKTPKKPEWDIIATTEKLEEWVEPNRLPPPFEFVTPLLMRRPRLYEVAKRIIRGELRKLEEANHFRWVGQLDGAAEIVPRRQAGAKRKLSSEEANSEEININENLSDEGDKSDTSVAAPPAKKVRKVKSSQDEPPQKRGSKKTIPGNKESGKMSKGHKSRKAKANNGEPPEASIPVVTQQSQAPCKPQSAPRPHPHPTKQGKSGDSEEDSDSDEESNDVAYVIHRKLPAAFNGDYKKWYYDFEECRKALDWEARESKPMGEDIIMAIRFIEATEVEEVVQLGDKLEVGVLIKTTNNEIGLLFDELMQTNLELHSPSAYRNVKDWKEEQFRRWAVGSFAVSARSEKGVAYKRTGHVYPAWLIYMEIVMRGHWPTNKWFDYTWRGARPHLVKEIAESAGLHSRNVMPEHLIVCHGASNWKRTSVVKDMKEWYSEMDEGMFLRGCVEEIFLWAYAIHMIAGPGGQGNMEWCRIAVADTTQWLKNGAEELEPSILVKREQAFKGEKNKLKAGSTDKGKKAGNAEAGNRAMLAIPSTHGKPSAKRPPPSDQTTRGAKKSKLDAIPE
ncbi:hypothetical protein M422DRAFT_257480 [Sphaerobolus stellatus SS14]|uniref:Uncharacterized protein n=1 Tax=Sphaerobolus stellatus (strain SS14) TaxID=990650 RepID=A0A0C9U9A0_SPHS4|nr:hypothetical protein M422DRAFT_257480 [Sphaerobolus stellatus SS14]